MKKLNFLIAVFALLAALTPSGFMAQNSNPLPAGTICIKSPLADDANVYFSKQTTFSFEVYKPTKAQMEGILAAFQKDASVENITAGVLTGDYQAYNLSLKSARSKDWFKTTFKKAGLATIRLNRQEVLAIDKL